MKLGKKAVSFHKPGTNCAQCVLLASRRYSRLNKKTCMKLGSGFGGGVKSGEICGAISGAVMCLGLCDKADMTKDFVKNFSEHNGSVRCVELKGKAIPCDDLIKYSADLLGEFLKK